jgi:hypothetical protein
MELQTIGSYLSVPGPKVDQVANPYSQDQQLGLWDPEEMRKTPATSQHSIATSNQSLIKKVKK